MSPTTPDLFDVAPRRTSNTISFVDLQAQRQRLGQGLDTAIARVLEHGRFVMGPEIGELEAKLADFCGAKHAITCSSGTDAIILGLMANGISAGDAVLMPSCTFVATAEAVVRLGAVPVFVDVRPDTFNLDPVSLEHGIRTAIVQGLAPRAVIAVDLFGQPCAYEAIEAVCARHELWLMVDAAQSFGATYRERRIGKIGLMTATSFFPTKPLGCYGDGGCVFVDDDRVADVIRSLRLHGRGQGSDDNVRIGMNGRLDTLQAAILLEKLKIFPDEVQARRNVAARYEEGLGDFVRTPRLTEGAMSVWAQYTVILEHHDRDAMTTTLNAGGIPTRVYYRKPLHLQPAYRRFPTASGALPIAEALSSRVLSLPMHPYLDAPTQQTIIQSVRAAIG